MTALYKELGRFSPKRRPSKGVSSGVSALAAMSQEKTALEATITTLKSELQEAKDSAAESKRQLAALSEKPAKKTKKADKAVKLPVEKASK